ncbi:MAG: PaaI family thioesterase [Pyrinomonadaceae bacterium]
MNSIELSEKQLARIREQFEQVPLARLIGLQLGHVARGTATLRIIVRDELKQNKGLLHGGVIASLIDTAAAFAALTVLEESEQAATIDLTIHYLRPVTTGEINARATVLRAGRRIIFLNAEVFDEPQTLVATAVTTFARLS